LENKDGIKSFYARHKRTLIFIVKFLFLAAVLNACYYGYVGLVDPKGSYYSGFLARFSIIDLITQAIIHPVKWFMELLGYTMENYDNVIRIAGSFGVKIVFPCLGIGIMIVLVSFIISYPLTGEKIKFIILGIIAVHLINIARIFTILAVNHKYPQLKGNTHEYFNYIAWLMCFLVIWFYTRHHRNPA
jgi:exosortase/archaeosortase family protein